MFPGTSFAVAEASSIALYGSSTSIVGLQQSYNEVTTQLQCS